MELFSKQITAIHEVAFEKFNEFELSERTKRHIIGGDFPVTDPFRVDVGATGTFVSGSISVSGKGIQKSMEMIPNVGLTVDIKINQPNPASIIATPKIQIGPVGFSTNIVRTPGGGVGVSGAGAHLGFSGRPGALGVSKPVN